jgi:hypothetical protein
MKTRKLSWVVALILTVASGGVAWAAPEDGGDRGARAPAVWEWLWSSVAGWLGVDGSESCSVGGSGQSNHPPATSAPAPNPPSTQSGGDHGGGLDPSG